MWMAAGDVIEVDGQLAQLVLDVLVLDVLDLAGNLGALGDKPRENMCFYHSDPR